MRTIDNLIIGTIFAVFVGSAQALPITDIYTPSGGSATLTTNTPYNYTHNLLTHGFVPALHELTSTILTLAISGPGGQNFHVALDGTAVFGNSLDTFLGNQPLSVALSYLQHDGLLNVSLTKGGGAGSTFTFTSSTLFAEGVANEAPEAVPEPGSLALLGLGLMALFAVRRRTVRLRP